MQSELRKKLLDAFTHAEGEFLSGQYLADLIGCSRTAVWKHIEDLRKEGFILEAVRRKGYRIVKTPENIIPDEIRLGLKTEFLGRQIHYEESVDSTQKLLIGLPMMERPKEQSFSLKNSCQGGEEWTGNGIHQNIPESG